jgi:hypothetical protein
VAAEEVTRAICRWDMVSGMDGSGQGQRESGGGGAGRSYGRDALGGQDRADRASGAGRAGDTGLPVGVGLGDRVTAVLSGNAVVSVGA